MPGRQDDRVKSRRDDAATGHGAHARGEGWEALASRRRESTRNEDGCDDDYDGDDRQAMLTMAMTRTRTRTRTMMMTMMLMMIMIRMMMVMITAILMGDLTVRGQLQLKRATYTTPLSDDGCLSSPCGIGVCVRLVGRSIGQSVNQSIGWAREIFSTTAPRDKMTRREFFFLFQRGEA